MCRASLHRGGQSRRAPSLDQVMLYVELYVRSSCGDSSPMSGTSISKARVDYAALTAYTPYVTQWSEERDPPTRLIELPGRGIGYLDETLADRDEHGVLWYRTPSRPGHGEPLFAKVHPLRQRRTMRRL